MEGPEENAAEPTDWKAYFFVGEGADVHPQGHAVTKEDEDLWRRYHEAVGQAYETGKITEQMKSMYLRLHPFIKQARTAAGGKAAPAPTMDEITQRMVDLGLDHDGQQEIQDIYNGELNNYFDYKRAREEGMDELALRRIYSQASPKERERIDKEFRT